MKMLDKIKTVVVVDDCAENRTAAEKALLDFLPGVTVITFPSAKEFLEWFSVEGLVADLVLSDFSMETPDAGVSVAKSSYSKGIPATIITGGIGHGKPYVLLGYPKKMISGSKENPDTWAKILTVVLGGDKSSNGLLTLLWLGKADRPLDVATVCAITVTPLD